MIPGRLPFLSGFTPFPSCGSASVYMTPTENVTDTGTSHRHEFTPVSVTEREFHSGT